jgi:hypothetical protein
VLKDGILAVLEEAGRGPVAPSRGPWGAARWAPSAPLGPPGLGWALAPPWRHRGASRGRATHSCANAKITVKIGISVYKLGLPRALRKALRRLHAPSKASRRAQRHRQEVTPPTFSQYRYFALFSPACWPVAARWSFHWGGEQLLPTIRDPEPMSPTRTPRRGHCKHRELHCRPC